MFHNYLLISSNFISRILYQSHKSSKTSLILKYFKAFIIFSFHFLYQFCFGHVTIYQQIFDGPIKVFILPNFQTQSISIIQNLRVWVYISHYYIKDVFDFPKTHMQKDRQVIHKLKCISVVSLMFMTVEIIGGIMANSVAILADAFHLLSDVLAYVISLQAVLMSYKKPPFFMTFGYEKVQPLGALINVSIIWFVTIELVIEATERIINKSVVQDPLYMLLTSFFGLGCNLYIMRVLHSDTEHGGHTGCSHSHGDHGHSHGHSHSHNGKKCSHDHSHNSKSIKNQSPKQKQHKHTHKCNHKHDHNYDYKHQEHDHTYQSHDHEQHDHQFDDRANQDKEHQHQHQHQHDHDHSHHQNKYEHKHEHNCKHGHDHKNSESQASQSSRQFICDIDHDHAQDHKNCNSKGYSSLTQKYYLNQQIAPYTYTAPYKLDLPTELNLSDENLQRKEKQRARRQLFNNINIQAAYIHIISDIILSIGVIISALIIFYGADPQQWTYWQLADPFCTYLFSIMAIYSTVGIAKDSVIILLDGCDDKELLKQIASELNGMQQILSYKDFKLWSLNRSKFCACIKITLSKQNFSDIKTRDQIRDKVIRLFSSRQIRHYVEIQQQIDRDQEQKVLRTQ